MKTIISLITASILLSFAAICSAQTIPSYVPTSGLVGWWPFNGNANDASGNGNNGTLVNGPALTTDRYGNSNSAYSFDGINDYITVPNSASLNITGLQISISMWVNYQNLLTDSKWKGISKGGWDIGSGYELLFRNSLNNDKGYAGLIGAQSGFEVDSFNTFQNQWVNLTGTFINGVGKLYINGVSQTLSPGTGFATLLSNANELLIGKRNPGNSGSGFVTGKIDDVGIWNRSLTPQEVITLYQGCSGSSIASIVADGPTTFCAGNNVMLTCNKSNATYQWKKYANNILNATARSFTATTTGNYTCVITNACGTTSSNTITVTTLNNASTTITAIGNTSFCTGDSVELSATNPGIGYSIQWYRSNISIQGATSYSFVAKQPGNYKVVTKNSSNGCSRISSGISTIVNCRIANPNVIAVDNNPDLLYGNKLSLNQTENKITIFPNPNEGSFTFEYVGIESDGLGTIEILNILGKVIYSTTADFTGGFLTKEINLQESFTKGIYFVNLHLNGEIISSKVMLQ